MSFVYFQISECDLIERANKLGRFEQLGGYAGCRALFDYYSDLAEDIGELIHLDVIGICCDWTHYATLDEAAEDYFDPQELRKIAELDDDDRDDRILDYFRNETTVLKLDNGQYMLQSF